MSLVRISSSKLSGTLEVPPSKSITHRAVICAALACGISKISPISMSSDVCTTIRAISDLGVKVSIYGNTLIVDSTSFISKSQLVIDCGESASTLRFMIPITSALGIPCRFIGRGNLPNRPIDVYSNSLCEHGINFRFPTNKLNLPVTVSGKLTPGKFILPGNISSQFISGLLLCAPILRKSVEIELTTPLESSSYVNMTISIMRKFGVLAERTKTGFRVMGGQSYSPFDCNIESDWSQASFFMAAGALGGNVSIRGLNIHSKQADSQMLNILKQFGADITFDNDVISVRPKDLKGINIDASQIPDLVPILSVIASLSSGETIIGNAARLRLKESDRLNAICSGLSKMGALISQSGDSLHISGKSYLTGGYVNGYRDHRIVMALSIAALRATEETVISDAESIEKSYPSFFKDYNLLGGKADVFNNRK